jgi:hypothetical protein
MSAEPPRAVVPYNRPLGAWISEAYGTAALPPPAAKL